jgi:transcriptional regulator with XRE-family HTH domain
VSLSIHERVKMTFDSKTFGANILGKLLLEEKSLRDAAKESGVSISTLSRITRGEDPDIHTFAAIIRWMDVDANVFIQPHETTPPEQDEWTELYLSLLHLGVPHDLIKALMTILRLIKSKGEEQHATR